MTAKSEAEKVIFNGEPSYNEIDEYFKTKEMKDRESVTTNGRAVFYAAMWNDLRRAAMDKGWALALHGSLARDMDIIAVPWVEGASSPIEMIEALKDCFDKPDKIMVSKTDMPNNRIAFTLSIFADFYLDINIIKNWI